MSSSKSRSTDWWLYCGLTSRSYWAIAIGTSNWTDRFGCCASVAARNVRCGYASDHRSDDDGGDERGDGSMRSAKCSAMSGAAGADDGGSASMVAAEAAAIPNLMSASCASSLPRSSDHSCCCW